MALFEFSQGAAMFDVTPVENMFLLEYLPSVPEGFLRPYLYARMLALHPELGDTLEDIARALRMDVADVENAFLFWERQGLMQKMASNPPAYHLLPVRTATSAPNTPSNREYYEYRDYTAALQAIFGAEDLLHPQEYRLANDWLNVLGLSQEAVLFLVENEKKRSKAKRAATVFRRVDKLAAGLADRGAHTFEEVRKLIAIDEDGMNLAAAVLKRLSIHRSPTEDELRLAQKWLSQWHCTRESVLEACEETVRSRQPSFAYLDKILSTRRQDPEGAFASLKRVLAELGSSAGPTPDQLKRYASWRAMGFAEDTIQLAAVQLNRRKRHSFEDLEWLLGKWAEQKLYSPEAAEEYVRKNSALRQQVRALLERAGTERNPSLADIALLEQWQGRYTQELIECAADCARGTQLPMKYMQKLLESWSAAGIRDVASALAQHKAATNAHHAAAASGAASNPALNYQQRTYTSDDFGDDFFFDPEKQRYGGDAT